MGKLVHKFALIDRSTAGVGEVKAKRFSRGEIKMSFYDLTKEERKQKTIDIQESIRNEITSKKLAEMNSLFDHKDTYYRKAAYSAVGKIY